MLQGLQPRETQGGGFLLVNADEELCDWSCRGPTWTADQVSGNYLDKIRAVPERPGYPWYDLAHFTPCGLLEMGLP